MSAPPPPPSQPTLAGWAVASAEPLAITDDAGAVVWCNAAFEQRFGRNLPAPLLLAPPAHPGEHIAIGEGWFAVHAQRVAEGLAWRLEDHSAQHEADRLKELLDIAQEFGRVGLWERDLATGQGRWDRHVFAFWGLDPAQGTPGYAEATRYVHPEDHFTGAYANSLNTLGRHSQHYRVVQPDGSMRRIHSQWEVKPGADGRAERVVGVMMDDTEVYELARSLGDATAQLQLAVELADIAI